MDLIKASYGSKKAYDLIRYHMELKRPLMDLIRSHNRPKRHLVDLINISKIGR